MAEKTDRMRKQKQTNRELFMEKLQDADMKKFVELITCHGKCTRCSGTGTIPDAMKIRMNPPVKRESPNLWRQGREKTCR